MFYCDVIDFSPGETWDRARKLRDKMATNMVMAKDRLDLLGEEIHLCISVETLSSGVVIVSINQFWFSVTLNEQRLDW